MLKLNSVNKNELIKSYGFIEKVATNKTFLREYLEMASMIGGTSSAYISLIDEENQYILSSHKFMLDVVPREHSICYRTIQLRDVLVIEDIKSDERTKHLSVVADGEWASYVGVPLINAESHCIGAFCIIDKDAKQFTEQQIHILKTLAKQVINILDNQRGLIGLIKEINSNFEDSDCDDLFCLQTELVHLSTQVVKQNNVIQEQKKELEAINDSLKTFAHIAAHDLRAPLRTIKSFVQLMEDDLSKKSVDFNKEYMNFVKTSANNTDRLILDMLALAKTGHDNSIKELLSILDILKQVELNLKNEITESNAKIIFPDNNLTINCNRTKMIQLFQNIIANSIKYRSDQRIPEIRITANKTEDRIFIKIADNGIGMENVDEIFKPFKRLDNADNFEGTGIGLATCKKILDSMNANYSVKSELDKGTTFYCDFPCNI